MGNPVPQTVQEPLYDKALGKRKATGDDSDDSPKQTPVVPGLVYGQLVTNHGNSAYQYQNYNGSNALEHVSWADAEIAERQKILSDIAEKARLEAAQKVQAEELAERLFEEEQAKKEAEFESNKKAKIDQQQQTNEQFRNTQQFGEGERTEFEIAMFGILQLIGGSSSFNRELFLKLYDCLVTSMLSGETSMEKGYTVMGANNPIKAMQKYFDDLATKQQADFKWVERAQRQTRSRGGCSSDAS